tara:strand:- start:260 stop:613 length:354 start_codon:yes stop_codon:yes gene_type:complete
MKSRHTLMRGKITRSFGVDEESAEDLVIELSDGQIVVRREPLDRKIKRGERLPSVTLDPGTLLDQQGKPEAGVQELLVELCSRLPIAKFEEGPADKVDYRAKVWLLAELKQIIEDNK